jgi:hypothetical protein
MIIATLILLLPIAFYGAVLARAFDGALRGLELLATGFLVGCGVLTLELLLLSISGLIWTRTSILLGALPALIAGAMIASRKRLPGVVRVPYTRPAAMLDLLIVLPIIGHGFYATWTGLYEWDFFGIWGLKGRTFFDAGGVDWHFLETNISHPDYPLLAPLLFDLVSIVGGRWEERPLGLIFTALCGALVIIVRSHFAAELKSHTFAALAALVIVFPALNLWVGLAEAAVMAFGCAGLLYLRRTDPASVRVGAILLGFAAWSKNEGLALIAVTVISLLVAGRLRDVPRLWPALIIIAPWLIVRASFELKTAFLDHQMFARMWSRLADPLPTLRVFGESPPDQPLFWIAVVLCLLVYARTAFTRERFLTVALLLQFSLFLAQGIATPFELAPHVSLTMNRLPQQLAPAFAFLAAVLLMPALMAARGAAPHAEERIAADRARTSP